MELVLMQLAMETHLRQLHEELPRRGYRTAQETTETTGSANLAPLARVPVGGHQNLPTDGRGMAP